MLIFLLLVIVLILLFGASAFIGAVGLILGSVVGFIGLVWLLATYGTIGILYAVGSFLVALAALYGIGIIEGKIALKKLYKEKGWTHHNDYNGKGYVLLDHTTGKPVDLYGNPVSKGMAFIYDSSGKADEAMSRLEAKTNAKYTRSKTSLF